MKKITTIIMIFGLILVQAQVGINTETPDAEADLELGSNNKALLLNRVAGVSRVNNPKEGMLVYDTSEDYRCVRAYQRNGWTGCLIGGATDNTQATIADQTKTIFVYEANGVIHGNKINNTTDVVKIKIPYSNASGSYAPVSVSTTAAPGHNGDINTLTLTIPGGDFTANGELEATIKVGGADEEYLIFNGESTIATFPVVMSGISYNVVLKGIGGITDRNYGDGVHDFIYMPVEVTGTHNVNGQPYKKTWLNMNLGAEYANVNSPDFNPVIVKTGTATHSDPKTYGSLFQWQRKADGHEFRNSQTTATKATSWAHESTSFITPEVEFFSLDSYNWVAGSENDTIGINVQLWQSGGANNPCPVGYHVPTHSEWGDFQEAVTGARVSADNPFMFSQSILPNFPAAAKRNASTGITPNVGVRGYYWSSEIMLNKEFSAFIGRGAYLFSLEANNSEPDDFEGYSTGLSVRCIKD